MEHPGIEEDGVASRTRVHHTAPIEHVILIGLEVRSGAPASTDSIVDLIALWRAQVRCWNRAQRALRLPDLVEQQECLHRRPHVVDVPILRMIRGEEDLGCGVRRADSQRSSPELALGDCKYTRIGEETAYGIGQLPVFWREQDTESTGTRIEFMATPFAVPHLVARAIDESRFAFLEQLIDEGLGDLELWLAHKSTNAAFAIFGEAMSGYAHLTLE